MKIALIGTAPASIQIAPYHSPEWTIWGCSPGAYGVAQNPKVWFELHRYEPGQPWFSEGYCDFLRNFKGPVIMAQQTPEIPNCHPIPWRELIAKYGPYNFTSSLAWMFVMAMEKIMANPEDGEHIGTIGLWGVDMAAAEEYESQRLGLQNLGTWARALNIEVGVPPESDLFRPPPLYGVCEISHGWIKQTARTRELNHRLKVAADKQRETTEEIIFLKGALDDQKWQLYDWFGSEEMMGNRYVEPPEVPILKEILKPEHPA